MQVLLVGLGAFAFSVVVQTTAVAVGVALMEALIRRGHAHGSFWNIVVVLQLTVFLLLGSHLLQMAFWALVFVWCGQFRDFDAAFCHSAVNYSTLGYGDMVMSRPWQLLGPMEAMDGMLMAGLSAAILFAVLHRLVQSRLPDPQAGRRPMRDEPGGSPEVSARVSADPIPRGLDGDHA
jgi:hypothetical protein